jgi:hypothetical protein
VDEDIEEMSREQLIAEAKKLRARYRQSLDEQLPGAPRSDAPYRGDRTAQR